MQRITGSRAIGRREALGARHRQTATKIRLEAEIGQGHDLGRESSFVVGEGEGNDEGGGATERHHAYLQNDDVIEDRYLLQNFLARFSPVQAMCYTAFYLQSSTNFGL